MSQMTQIKDKVNQTIELLDGNLSDYWAAKGDAQAHEWDTEQTRLGELRIDDDKARKEENDIYADSFNAAKGSTEEALVAMLGIAGDDYDSGLGTENTVMGLIGEIIKCNGNLQEVLDEKKASFEEQFTELVAEEGSNQEFEDAFGETEEVVDPFGQQS